MKNKLISSIIVSTVMASASAAMAGAPQFSGGKVKVSPDQSLSNMTLTISGPDGFHVKEFSSFGTPSASIYEDGQLADGLYHWELSGATSERLPEHRNRMNNGRGENAIRPMYKGASESGSFIIKGGAFVGSESNLMETEIRLEEK